MFVRAENEEIKVKAKRKERESIIIMTKVARKGI
jgi:hypothetical protein